MSKHGLKLAVVSQEKLDLIIALADAIESFDNDDSRETREGIIKASEGAGWPLRHIVFAYETLFNNCCDPKAETLEFKPSFQAFEDAVESASGGAKTQGGGLHLKYLIFKADGTPVNPASRRFVLNVDSEDLAYRKASREALKAFAVSISATNSQWALDLKSWLADKVEIKEAAK